MGETFLDDGDVRLYHGDVTDVLAGMPDESVDCVVTSPPYWGLRSYLDDDHEDKSQELGLEPTPDLYVERIVAVFRQVRRVLAPHGTAWVNLGDSYAQGGKRRDEEEAEEGERKRVERQEIRDDDAGVYAVPTGWGKRGDRAAQTAAAGLKPKDLCGIPWRVAFALQADGWWLRADVIWSKPNPMPESVTDRPTKAHEYVFLLTKQPRYYFDQEAVREGVTGNAHSEGRGLRPKRSISDPASVRTFDTPAVPSNRNVRSVWQIATQPYPEAHFATYPEELVRRCVLAGCPVRVCRVCGKPSERIVESEPAPIPQPYDGKHGTSGNPQSAGARIDANKRARRAEGYSHEQSFPPPRVVGWSECDCLLSEGVPSEVSAASHADASFPVAPGAAPSESKWRAGVVLDPFIGSGTTCKVARDHGRHSIGIDLSVDYLNLAARRLQQLSLLT